MNKPDVKTSLVTLPLVKGEIDRGVVMKRWGKYKDRKEHPHSAIAAAMEI